MADQKPEELVVCAMVRARFSENLARLAGDPRSSTSYLIGLFSLLDALLDQPLDAALKEVGLAPKISEVLLGTPGADGPLTEIHSLMHSYETGEWEQVQESAQSLGLTDADVADAYVESTEWANQTLRQLRVSEASATSKSERAGLKKERRRSKRDALAASVTVLWGNRPEEECRAHANLVDVSAFGVRFRLLARIPLGAWLMFNYHQMGIGGRGIVRHCCMVKGMYEIGVEFSSGTGWNGTSERFGTHLRNLNVAVNRHEDETAAGETGLITGEATLPHQR